MDRSAPTILPAPSKRSWQRPPHKVGLSLAALLGAIMVGISGACWLTSEVDKNLLRVATAEAAGAQPSAVASHQIALAAPTQALNIAKNMK
jgi:hypothetical protein